MAQAPVFLAPRIDSIPDIQLQRKVDVVPLVSHEINLSYAAPSRRDSQSLDSAGLAIASPQTQKGPLVSERNTNDGINMPQTAEGGIATVQANLQRMKAIATQLALKEDSAADAKTLQAE